MRFCRWPRLLARIYPIAVISASDSALTDVWLVQGGVWSSDTSEGNRDCHVSRNHRCEESAALLTSLPSLRLPKQPLPTSKERTIHCLQTPTERMRLSMLMSLIRPTGPIIVGISLGFTLSLLSVTWVDESCDSDWIGATDEMLVAQPAGSLKGARKPSSISTGTTDNGNIEGEFEPRIVPYNKPAQQDPPKKVFR